MSDCCSQPGLMPFAQAKQLLLDSISAIEETEIVSLDKANGRVLAQDIDSPVNVPPHDNSAMDGYAFQVASLAEGCQLSLVGKSFAGAPYQGNVAQGECIRIMTGAKMPDDCDTVEMQENCTANGGLITFNQDKRLGQHVRRCGEDIKLGETLYKQGHRLSAPDIGALASIGIGTVIVYRQLTVALIATGDELKQPGQRLSEGDIYESNSFFLRAMLSKLSVKVIDFGIIPDNLSQIKQAFVDADQQADVVISSGGVSVGEADYTKAVLEELGEIGFWKLAMKPGKPFAFGKLSNSIFFGLPGNPVSALVTFYQLAMPGLFKLQHASEPQSFLIKAIAQESLKKSSGRMDFQRGVFSINEQGEAVVSSTGSQGSGILTSLAKANCFIVLEQERGRVAQGDVVNVTLFDHLLKY